MQPTFLEGGKPDFKEYIEDLCKREIAEELLEYKNWRTCNVAGGLWKCVQRRTLMFEIIFGYWKLFKK